MLLQQHQQILVQERPTKKITDEEALVWCYRNANTEWNNANNTLEIIVNLCTCSAKEVDLAKVIRSQIDFVSDQLSNKTYQSFIYITNDSNSNLVTTDGELANSIEIENLRDIQSLLQKKFRLLSILRIELTNSKCECSHKSNNNILNYLRKYEFNCKMWFRHIKMIEAKMKCSRESLPFDLIKVVRQLLDNNELNLNSIPISIDINNNLKNNGIKTEKFSPNEDCSELAANDCSYDRISYTNEYENKNSFIETKNMQILRYDSLLSVNEENSLVLQPINSNDMTTNTEMDCEVRTFQELQPISSNVGLNYSAHEISLRSNALLYQEFDYRTNNNSNANHFSDDILPQITAVEIDQILNN